MNYEPKRNWILLDEVEEAERTASGIWIPDKARMPLNQGIVRKIGPMCEKDICKVGEIVLFAMHSEHRIQHDRKWFILIQDTDVMAGWMQPPPSENPAK